MRASPRRRRSSVRNADGNRVGGKRNSSIIDVISYTRSCSGARFLWRFRARARFHALVGCARSVFRKPRRPDVSPQKRARVRPWRLLFSGRPRATGRRAGRTENRCRRTDVDDVKSESFVPRTVRATLGPGRQSFAGTMARRLPLRFALFALFAASRKYGRHLTPNALLAWSLTLGRFETVSRRFEFGWSGCVKKKEPLSPSVILSRTHSENRLDRGHPI